MKLIACPHCGARRIGPKTTQHPNGIPVVMGRWSGASRPIVIKCHRCTNSMKFTALDFNRLPGMSAEEVKDLGLYSQRAVE